MILHPGKLRPEFGGCNIAWGGEERCVTDYEVFVPKKPVPSYL